MAITKIRVRNFKSFADSGEVPIAPLTVIFGRNNTGKSSILQSLLLLTQTLDSPGEGASLNMRGPLYAAGMYSDIVHKHRASEHVEFRFEVATTPDRTDAIELEFASGEPQPPRLVRLEIRTGQRGSGRDSGNGFNTLKIKRARGYGGPFELIIGSKRLGSGRKANFLFSVNHLLPFIDDELPSRGRPDEPPGRIRASARQALKSLEDSLRSIRAVGAFRRQPDRRYEYAGRPPLGIDASGEHVIDALIEDSTRRHHRGELIGPVNKWLSAIGRVKLQRIRVLSKASKIYEIRLKDTDSGRWANFADVGFGIGQVLPVIVEGLRTPKDGTFLVQEPEIHLHPDAQLAMADFLIDLVAAGRRVIVETHSEPLLLRIRHRVVEQPDGRSRKSKLGPEDVSVIYVSKTEEGASCTQALTLDELGQIKNWPTGFMEEVTQERMDLLGSMTKQAGK
ncbi:MAG: DUF3696 domain-containing protein [Tepidisphaeraceae bacterium]